MMQEHCQQYSTEAISEPSLTWFLLQVLNRTCWFNFVDKNSKRRRFYLNKFLQK